MVPLGDRIDSQNFTLDVRPIAKIFDVDSLNEVCFSHVAILCNV